MMSSEQNQVRDQQIKLVATVEERRMIAVIAAAHQRSAGDILRLLARQEYERLRGQQQTQEARG